MISVEEAYRLIFKNLPSPQTEEVQVVDSFGMALAEDIKSTLDMPLFNKSAVDGYGIKIKNIKNLPARLKCAGFIEAGDNFKRKIKKGECVKIMTGGFVPAGVEGIVMVEDTTNKNNYVEINRLIEKGQNICKKGEDLKRGQPCLKKGTLILGPEIHLLSALGKRTVKIFLKPEVAVLNTGGEIVQPGDTISGSKIYNTNGPFLVSQLKNMGLPVSYLGIANDRREVISAEIKKGLKRDILIISGGVSKGDYDLVPEILEETGVKIIFHGVRMKPGKPLLFGKKGKKIVFGLPGNPVSTFLSFILFIEPSIKRMTGVKAFHPGFLKGVLARDYMQKTGRKHFVPVKIKIMKDKTGLFPVHSHGSGDIFSLVKSDGFAVIPENISFARKGIKADYLTWKM